MLFSPCKAIVCSNIEPTKIFTNKNGVTFISKVDYFLTNISQNQYKENEKNVNIGDNFAIIITLHLVYKSICIRFLIGT